MKTDVPLKYLTTLRGADLLPILGLPAAELIEVVSRELPASATRLDTLLRIRSPQGQEYLHLLEWQGYADPTVLWRVVGYLAWLGQREPHTTVAATVVYLLPEYDMGDTLTELIDGVAVRQWHLGCVRLWEQDAQAAVASANLGLAVLSPLMRHADAALVEAAAELVLQTAPLPQQNDLLSILGVFAEPFYATERFLMMIGRERLMRSTLFETLMKDREAALLAQSQSREAELLAQLQSREAELLAQYTKQEQAQIEGLQDILSETILIHFPDAPLAFTRDIQRIAEPAALRRLIIAVQQAGDVAAVAQLLREAAGEP